MVAGIQNTSLYDNGTLVASWTSDAPILEIPLYAQYGAMRLTVDGREWINACQQQGSTPFAMPPNDGDVKTVRIDWTESGGRKFRQYRAEVGGYFAGARIGREDALDATELFPQTRVAFVGDSYTEGAGANTPWEGWAAICAHELGVEPVFLGSGGTGYFATPYAGRFPFIERLDDLKALSPPPNAIVVAGGINDRVPDDVLGNAVNLYFDALQANFPTTRVIVIGPWNPLGRSPDNGANTIQACALAHGFPFVDVRDWLPRDNFPAYIGADNVHPTPLGHQHIGLWAAEALKPLLGN
jgi:lysophospholipase L1-like esterase